VKIGREKEKVGKNKKGKYLSPEDYYVQR